MTTAVQRRRGTSTEHASFTGLDGEITVNTTTYTLHVHDGATVGGIVLAKADGSNIVTSSIDINGGTIDGTVIGGSSAAAGTFTSITGTSANINGTVTADGLTVQTTNGLNVLLESSNSYQYLQFKNTLETNNYLGFVGDDFSVTAANKKYLQVEGNGDISFYEDTGTTAKFFWDASAESLGIGTSSAEGKLRLSGDGTSSGGLVLDNGAQRGYIYQNGATMYNTVGSSAKTFVWGQEGGAELMRISSSGNVGIGTTLDNSSLGKLLVEQSGNTDGLGVVDSATTFTTFVRSHNTAGVGIVGTNGTQPMTFAVNNAEAMRINSSGTVLIGTTDSDVTNNTTGEGANIFSNGTVAAASTSYCLDLNRTNSTVGEVARFRKQATQVGSITVTASATAYNITSDYRLKEDVQDMVGATDRVMALKPCNFAWKSTGERVDGFLAHEAQAVVPEAVHGVKDAMRTEEYEVSPAVLDEDGNVVTEAVMGTREVPDYQGIDPSKLVPLLTKALQEALQRIEALEAKLA